MDLLNEISDFLFEGAVDPREFISKEGPDQSEVHVPKALESDKKKTKWKEDVALATNAGGMIAGPAALGMAIKERKKGGIPRAGVKTLAGKKTKLGKTKTGKKMRKIAVKLDKPGNKKYKIAAGVAGGTMIGLQTANWAGDTIATQMINDKKKAAKAAEAKKPEISKSLVPVTVVDVNPVMEDELTWSGEIMKTDTDKRQVFGWCSLSSVNGEDVVDRQGDYIPLEEVEKSAYDYVIHSRKGGDMHKRDGDTALHTSDMIESFVVTPEKLEQMGLPEDSMPHGWWVGFKVNDDDQWEAVKKGSRNHFSIHGRGKRVEKSL